jgi:hypothetical protein
VTDTDTAPGSVTDPAPDPTVPADAPSGSRLCRYDGCTNVLSPDLAKRIKYCDEHRPDSHGRRPGENDKAPRVVIDIGGKNKGGRAAAKDQRAADVAEAAVPLLSLIVSGLALSGDEVCTAAWLKQVPQIAVQLGELSRYHPGLAKLFISTGGDNEFTAWMGLSMSVLPALIATLAHHNLLPEKMAAHIGGIAVAVSTDGAPTA